MKNNTTTQAPATDLLMSEGGEIACNEHAPFAGTDTRVWGGWAPITKREAAEFTRDVGRAPACETCMAMARNGAK